MLTLSRICGSGAQSIVTGAQMIMLGEAETVVSGGMENSHASCLTQYADVYKLARPPKEGTVLEKTWKIIYLLTFDGMWFIYGTDFR